MKKMPTWAPYAIGAGVLAVAGFFIYRRLSTALPNVGQSISTSLIDFLHPKGVTNVATTSQMALPTSAGLSPMSLNVTPEYQAALNGFYQNNPQYTPRQVLQMLIARAWKIGDPPPPGLRNWQ